MRGEGRGGVGCLSAATAGKLRPFVAGFHYLFGVSGCWGVPGASRRDPAPSAGGGFTPLRFEQAANSVQLLPPL